MVKKRIKTGISKSDLEQGFITMIIMMLVIVGVILYFAYKNVANG